jgi:hypothetical protein
VVHILGDGANITGYPAGGGKWVWENATGNSGGGIGGVKTFGFYFNAQLMRFIRPGMTRVKATSDVPLLRVIAFKNDARGSFSVVMLNGTDEELDVTLNSTGTIPDSLEMRTTSNTRKYVEGELQDGRSTVTVRSRAMVSLGFRIRGEQPVDPQPIREWRTADSAPKRKAMTRGAVLLFDLRGRALTANAAGRRGSSRMPGSVVVQRDATGHARLRVCGESSQR